MKQTPKAPLPLFISMMLDKMIEEGFDEKSTPLETYENYRDKMRFQAFRNLEEYTQMLEEGQNLVIHSYYFTKEEASALENKISRAQLNDSSIGDKLLEKGTFGEIIGFDKTFYQKAFERAKELLDNKETDNAIKAFLFLSHLEPAFYQYSFGLGLSLMEKNQPKEALFAFMNALSYSDEDAYMICIHMTDATITMREFEATKEILTYVKQETERKEDQKKAYNIACNRLEILKKSR